VNELACLVDLQVNGYAGVDFSSPALTIDQVLQAAQNLRRQGTALFCPTIVTAPWEVYTHVIPLLAQAKLVLANLDYNVYAQISGIHLEGPFISPVDGARGVHDLSSIRPASISDFDALLRLSSGTLRLLTLAPEIPGGLELVQHASSLGILVGLGHTLASADVIHEAVAAGARFSTHLGNGLPATIHRHHNPLWAQLTEPALYAMLIADGHHLPAEFVRVVIAVKSMGGVIVTSDAASPAGLPVGDYSFCGKNVRLDQGGKLYDPLTGYLAGSSANLSQCLGWLSGLGIMPHDLDRLCRQNALVLLGSSPYSA
jgi:N-acetylglucosamine-6-phosphate deacetylase